MTSLPSVISGLQVLGSHLSDPMPVSVTTAWIQVDVKAGQIPASDRTKLVGWGWQAWWATKPQSALSHGADFNGSWRIAL